MRFFLFFLFVCRQQIVQNVIIPAFLDFHGMFVMTISRMRNLSKLVMLKLLFPFVLVYRSNIFATVFLLMKNNDNNDHVRRRLLSNTSSVLP
jgi:hypothetical protein